MGTFESNITSLYGDNGKIWLNALPKMVAELANTYKLSRLKRIRNLTFHYVASGFQNDQPIILKLGMDTDGVKREAAALRAFSGFGAVKILEENEGLLLLERAIPGVSLKTYLPSKKLDAIRIACDMAKKLHQAPLPEGKIPHIRDWLGALDRHSKEAHEMDFCKKAKLLHPFHMDTFQDYLEKARELRDRLLKVPTEPVLLHGDLHPDNILQNDKNWLAIDPKGVVGYPINEVWAFLTDIGQDAEVMAHFLGFDVQDLRDWYFVHTLLATCWNLDDNIAPKRFLKLAAKAYPWVSK